MRAGELDPTRDRWAFGALLGFVISLFVVPAEWIPALEKVRPALVTSGVAAGLMLIRRLGRREPLKLDGLRGVCLLGLAAMAVASLGWSVNPEATRYTVLELLKLIAVYLTLVNVVSTPARVRWVVGAMVLSSMVTSTGVIHWYLRGEDLVEGFRGRWVGVYADPNHMAMDLGLVVPLALACLTRRGFGWPFRLASLGAAGLAVGAVVCSHSRGGTLGLVLGLGVWALREHRQRLFSLSAGGLLLLGLAIFAPKSFWDRNETVATFNQDASAMGRVHAWEVAARMSSDRPLLGVGAGAFRYAWPLYAPVEATTAYVAHNIFLDVVGELGWLGLSLFLLFVGSGAAGAVAASADPELGWIARALTASVVGYIVCDLFSGYILSTHFYLLFGLAAVSERLALLSRPDLDRAPSSVQRDFVWGG